MSSSTPVIPECIEEVPILEGFVPVPLVHTEATGSIEDIQIVEYPPFVQKGLDVNIINDPENVHLQHEETSEARLIVQDGDETVHLPSTELGDTPLKAETVDPFINKEAASIEERPIAIDSEETILEPPVQFSEVQGNEVLSRVFLFTLNLF